MDENILLDESKLLDSYGKYHAHLGSCDYKSHIAGVRECEKRRCKMEVIRSTCDRILCKFDPCIKCDHKLVDIRNIGWVRAKDRSQKHTGAPPRWLIPSLRATSPDIVMADQINSSLRNFIKDVGVCEQWRDDLYTADPWYYVPDFWKDESPIIYIYAIEDIEIQVLASTNIRCIIHSRDELQIAVITRAIYKSTSEDYLSLAIKSMCDGIPCCVDILRFASGHPCDIPCRDKTCSCYQHRCFHCMNHYKYNYVCTECAAVQGRKDNERSAKLRINVYAQTNPTIRYNYKHIVLPRGDVPVDSSEWAIIRTPAKKSEEEIFLDEAFDGLTPKTPHKYRTVPIDDFENDTVGKYTWTLD